MGDLPKSHFDQRRQSGHHCDPGRCGLIAQALVRNSITSAVYNASGRGQQCVGWMLVTPALLIVMSLNLFPILFTIGASFVRWNMARSRVAPQFIGMTNFEQLFREPVLLQAAFNTLTFVVGTVTLQTVLGVCIALLLRQNLRGSRLVLGTILIPMTIAPAVVSWLFSILLNETLGPIDYGIRLIGLASPQWLSSGHLVLFTLVLIDAWQWTPFTVIMVLAALRSQPASILEASLLDGAGGWQRFYHIVLPMLLPVLTITILLRIIDSLKMFDLVYLLTRGGPGSSSQTLGFLAYRLGMVDFDVGKSSALSTAMLIMSMIFSVTFYGTIERRGQS